MGNSKIKENIINANNSRLKIISLISLGFSVFVLVTDFLVHGVWQDEHLYLYKILDIIFTIISVSAISFFWVFKIRNITLQNAGIILFPFLFIIWSAIITGIGYSTLGFSTLLVVVFLTAFSLYLNLVVSIIYFASSGLALMITLYLMGDIKENYLSIIFLLIPIIAISVIISARNYKYKKSDLLNQEKMVELNQKLNNSIENLEEEVGKRTKEIMGALIKAEESDRLKSAFLSNMSHEVRTPMNGILGYTQLLKEPNLTHEEQQEFIKVIEKSGERMLNTLNDIVDFSKIESGNTKVDIKDTNINELIEFIYKFFKPEVESKGITFSYKSNLAAKESIIKTDKEKVYALLTNLVKNAIKFTNEGSIEIGYNKKGKYIEFHVKDTGVGIPKENMEIIFERFRQGSDSYNRNYEGSGLGLAIAKSYVEMLGGKIWVKSEEGKGSTFYFTISCNNELDIIPIKNAVSPEDNKVQKKLKILVVEDDETSFKYFGALLQKNINEVLYAKTGIDAISVCRNNPDIDLILMDIRMPVMDGHEATRQIRQFNTGVIIIAQTAYVLANDKEKAIEAGCNDYISKPINKTLLFELIKKHVNK